MEDRRKFYSEERDRFDELHRFATRKLNLLSLLRLLIFVVGIGISIFLFRFGTTAGIISLLLSTIIFLYLLRLYTVNSREKEFYFNLMIINGNELKCLDGDYSSFHDGALFSNHDHDFSHDIDLFGNKSLFQYLDRTCTEGGREKLAGWLKDPYSLVDQFLPRSESINELSERVEWRHKFIATGTMNQTTGEERRRLEEWLKEEPLFTNWHLARISTYVLLTINLGFLILAILGITPSSAFFISFLLNLLVLSFRLKSINRLHSLLSKQYKSLTTVKELVAHFNSEEFKSPLLIETRNRLSSGSYPALEAIGKLAVIIRDFDFRLNMLTGALLNGMLMWDFLTVLRLEKWKREVREHIPGWFDDIAMIDAFVSLSNYSFNNPSYVYPEMIDGNEFMIAEGLGHPLIMERDRIVNSFMIEEKGIINIITGANMAGKSTFLRTIAVNLLLAMTGAPVCATKFMFKPVKIFSSMRTSDSLSENESYFFAELKRLKILKERVEKREPLLFILDEILKGTNSKDKSEGSRMFVEKLIRNRATGIIATHDISLGGLEENFPRFIKNRCFEIQIEDDSISFDYILRDGITTRMNAAILMKQQGIID